MAGRNQPKTGGGSRKGIPNQLSKDIKGMIVGALNDAGGQKYLKQQAHKNPAAFLGLVAKVLPLQLAAEGGPLALMVVTGVHREPQKTIEHDPKQADQLSQLALNTQKPSKTGTND